MSNVRIMTGGGTEEDLNVIGYGPMEVPSRNYPGGTEERQENYHSDWTLRHGNVAIARTSVAESLEY